jgi:hypothetical protein
MTPTALKSIRQATARHTGEHQMSEILETWNRHPTAPAFLLPTDPAERDRYILEITGNWRRGAGRRLATALAAWQAATGFERDLCRYDLRRVIREFREVRPVIRETFSAYCRKHGVVRGGA